MVLSSRLDLQFTHLIDILLILQLQSTHLLFIGSAWYFSHLLYVAHVLHLSETWQIWLWQSGQNLGSIVFFSRTLLGLGGLVGLLALGLVAFGLAALGLVALGFGALGAYFAVYSSGVSPIL